MLRAIIVDDEPQGRTVLSQLLSVPKHSVEIVTECANLPEAVKEIAKHKPDVVFLDVQMPQYAGYEIGNLIEVIDFDIVFVTAYDHYAINAFELNAMDYILKPIDRNRLATTVKKLHEKKDLERKTIEYEHLLQSIKDDKHAKLIIPEAGNRRVIDLADIKMIQADGSYTLVYLANSEHFVVSKNLKFFEDKLKNHKEFFRTHRAYLCNLNYLDRLNKTEGILYLTDNVKVKVARSRMSELQGYISN